MAIVKTICCRNVPWMTLYQIPSSHVDWSENMVTWGRGGCFALHSENFYNLLLRQNLLRACMGDIVKVIKREIFDNLNLRAKCKKGQGVKN